MIIPVDTIAPIIYDELYAKNAIGLQGVELCPFLKEMDEREHCLQQRRIQLPPYIKDSYTFAPIAGIVGAILGGLVTGGFGFTAFLCGMSGLALSGKKVPKLKAAKEKLPERISRVIQKITRIQYQRFLPHSASDEGQLRLAQSHFEKVLRSYQKQLAKKDRFFYDSDSDSDNVVTVALIDNININFGQRS